jgi:hypothetical protein
MEKIRPDNKQSAAKGNPQTHNQKGCTPEGKTNWHWHIKHPVEFSKNNHTPKTNHPTRAAHPRGTRSTLPALFRGVKSGFPGLRGDFRARSPRLGPQETRVLFVRSSAGRPLRISPLPRPFPCQFVEHYREVPRRPNPPPATPLTACQDGPVLP